MAAASVVATEIDGDTRGVTVAPTALSVPEAGSRNYTVVLNTRPSGNVTVAVGSSGDGDLSASANALTFTTANWNAAQTVTVSAAADADTAAGTATFSHTPSGGGYTGVAAASVTATEADGGAPGVTVVPTELSVPEGGSRNYTVVLNTRPSGNVTVAVGSSGDGDLSASANALTFTTANWGTEQTVTVSAAQDSDALAGEATFTHTPSDGGYAGVAAASVVATEIDDETPGVTVAPTVLSVPEGGGRAYTVVLDARPTGGVTISVANDGGDPDLTASATALTFTTANWSTAQTVTVNAATDADALAGKATFSHTASNGGYDGVTIESVVATEIDNEAPGVTVAPTELSVPEGGSQNYAVVLDTRPSGEVTVSIARAGDGDLSASANALTFTTANWNAAQTVAVTAQADDDADNGVATFSHTARGGDYDGVAGDQVVATEADDETRGVTVVPTTLSVPEGGSQNYTVKLNTRPSGSVTITVARTGDADLSASANALTFTTANWSAAQTVTVTAQADDDADNGRAIFAHDASGGGYGSVAAASVVATEIDGDTRGVTVAPTALSVPEGGSRNYTVVLNTRPSGNVTVAVGSAGDGDLSASANALTFTTANWNAAQTVTVSAAADADTAAGTATFSHTPSGGGYTGVAAASVTATEADGGAPGVTVVPTELSVPEGGNRAYTVVLNTLPTGDVTISVANGGPDADLTASANALTFTTANWGTEQTVTVSAAQDSDVLAGTATFSHTPNGGGYNGVAAASVVATEIDDEKPGVTVAPTALSVPEGGGRAYTVVLDARPTGGVTISVANDGGDPDLTASATALTFTTANWSTAQTVTVNAATDADALAGKATFSHTASNGGYDGVTIESVVATEIDNEAPGVTVAPTELSVPEGGSQNYAVVLDTRPSGEVTVSIARAGDGDLSASANALTFTTANWNAAQTVAVTARADDDADNGVATFSHTARGGDYDGVAGDQVVATEADDETRGVTVVPTTLSVPEGGSQNYTVKLNTRPSGGVTVSIARTGDGDLSASENALTFTTANWSAAQSVTVTAQADDDADNGRAIFAHDASGGGYGSVAAASVVATEIDGDTRGVTLAPTALSVPEGGSRNYTVVLNTRPSGNVTVAVGSSGDGDLSASANALTFTTANWNAAQTVTVSAAADADTAAGTATFSHTPSGGGYTGVAAASVTATEADGGAPGVTVVPTELSVPEGGNRAYTVVLNTLPTGDVTISVANGGPDADLTASANALTFTTANWGTEQTVTVSAAQDSDVLAGTATFSHTPNGGGYNGVAPASVVATEIDDETPGVTVAPTALSVPEGGGRAYTVVLDARPTGGVTISVANDGGDADLTASATALTFTTANWSTAQTVTVSAATDADALAGEATFSHTASNGGYDGVTIESVVATEIDNEAPGITVAPTELSVPEGGTQNYAVVLDTRPSGEVTVSIARAGDGDLSASATALTFTTANWNAAQTVTVTAQADDDADNGVATFSHTARGGDYDGVAGDQVVATEADDDTRGIAVAPTALSVPEGGSQNYTVKLNTRPSGGVTITVARTGDADLSASANALTFTTANWSAAQTVTVTAQADDDADNGRAIFAHDASGGGYGSVAAASVVATEIDGDTRGVTVAPTVLSVPEGGSRNYTVVLNTRPSGNVTVAVGSSGDGDLSASANALTFTTANWNAAQTVTVSAAADADTAAGTATFSHTPSGGGYTGVAAASVTATEADGGTPGVTVVPTALSVPEGGSRNYTVVLNTRPSGNVTVAVGSSGDGDLSASANALTFTTANWGTEQTVTVNAAQDSDALAGEATFTHTPSGGGYTGVAAASVVATEIDDETPGVTVAPTELSVPEGGGRAYTVVLDARPTGGVTISITNDGRDADLSASATALTFTTANWSTAQTVTVNAAEDSDALAGEATFSHTATGANYGGVAAASVVATEIDDEAPGITVAPTELSVPEGGTQNYAVVLDTRPSGEVTVSIARAGDADLSASANALTFTTANWNAAQTVAVTAQADDDADNGTATFSHTGSGGDYNGVTGDQVVATEADDETRGVTVDPTMLSVPEGGSQNYTVKLKHPAVRKRDDRGRERRRRRRPHGVGDRPDLYHRELGHRADRNGIRRDGRGRRQWNRDLLPHPGRRRLQRGGGGLRGRHRGRRRHPAGSR